MAARSMVNACRLGLGHRHRPLPIETACGRARAAPRRNARAATAGGSVSASAAGGPRPSAAAAAARRTVGGGASRARVALGLDLEAPQQHGQGCRGVRSLVAAGARSATLDQGRRQPAPPAPLSSRAAGAAPRGTPAAAAAAARPGGRARRSRRCRGRARRPATRSGATPERSPTIARNSGRLLLTSARKAKATVSWPERRNPAASPSRSLVRSSSAPAIATVARSARLARDATRAFARHPVAAGHQAASALAVAATRSTRIGDGQVAAGEQRLAQPAVAAVAGDHALDRRRREVRAEVGRQARRAHLPRRRPPARSATAAESPGRRGDGALRRRAAAYREVDQFGVAEQRRAAEHDGRDGGWSSAKAATMWWGASAAPAKASASARRTSGEGSSRKVVSAPHGGEPLLRRQVGVEKRARQGADPVRAGRRRAVSGPGLELANDHGRESRGAATPQDSSPMVNGELNLGRQSSVLRRRAGLEQPQPCFYTGINRWERFSR